MAWTRIGWARVIGPLILLLAALLNTTPAFSDAAEDCKGSGDVAIAGCTELIQQDPNDAAAYLNRGKAYLDQADYTRAAADFTEAIEIDPTDAKAYYNRGKVYMQTGDALRGIADLQQALALDPEFAEAKQAVEKAAAALKSGAPPADPKSDADFKTCESFSDGKLQACNRAIDSGKFSGQGLAALYTNRGTAYFLNGDSAAALPDFTKAIELYPSNAAALSSRGVLYTDKGEYDLALKDLDQSIQFKPHPMALSNRAKVYAKKSDYDRAIADFSEAMRLAPPKQSTMQTNLYWERGDAYRLKGDREKAKADFDKALSLSSNEETKRKIEEDLKQLDSGTSASASPQQTSAPEPESATTSFPLRAGVYRLRGTNPDGSEYYGLVALAVEGGKFKLICWNGKKVFYGNGSFSGEDFVVKWSDKVKVTFTAGADGALEGETDSGDVTETLEPFALAAPNDVALAEGTYAVAGKVANGDTYDGTATITRTKKGYHVSWKTGPTSYEGSGKLADNLFTVTWGSTTPAVYALAANGSLKGLWDSGFGEETLTPEGSSATAEVIPQSALGGDPDRKDCNKRIAMDAALAACGRAIASGKYSSQDLALLYNNRGTVYASNKQDDLALADFSKAIELDPNLALAYRNRGRVCETLRRTGAAIDDYTRAIELNPDDAESKKGLKRIGPDIRKMRVQ